MQFEEMQHQCEQMQTHEHKPIFYSDTNVVDSYTGSAVICNYGCELNYHLITQHRELNLKQFP